jgi:tight adherence protein B
VRKYSPLYVGLIAVAIFVLMTVMINDLPSWLMRFMLASASFVAFATLLYGIVLTMSHDDGLADALKFYRDELDEADGNALARLADSQLIKQAVASTAKAAEKRGYLAMIELRLTQADVHMRPGEALFMTLVATLVSAVIAVVVLGPLAALLVAALMLAAPGFVLSHLAGRRRSKFTRQLPGALDLLAGTLRAGFSLPQGMQAISEDVSDPLAMEIKRVINEERLGRQLNEALQDVADRMQSPDFAWAVLAIRIQRQVGGNLAELLTTVARTMVERERLRREVRSLTAEGRLSAIILVALPPGIGGVVWFMNPTYVAPLLHTDLGQMGIGVGVVSMIIGWFMMQRIITIKA